MSSSDVDQTKLLVVANLAQKLREARKEWRREALARVDERLSLMERGLESAIMEALDEHKVVDVARAFTTPGKTPNRNYIYDVRTRNSATPITTSEYPFEWVPREIETIRGTRTVYDVHAELTNFGPDHVTGRYVWTHEGGNLIPQPGEWEPYPRSKFYAVILSQWFGLNPYPGDE